MVFVNSFRFGHNDLCWTRNWCILWNSIHFAMPSNFARRKSIAADDFHLHANVFYFHECTSKFCRRPNRPINSYSHLSFTFSAEHSSLQSDCSLRFDACLRHKYLRMDSYACFRIAQRDYDLSSESCTKSRWWSHSRFNSSAFVASCRSSAWYTFWSDSRMGTNRFECSR